MAWIESHTHVSRHRKLVQAKLDLDVSIPLLVGHLHLLWHAVLEQAEDGDISAWNDAFIAYSAGWTGDAKQFCDALRNRNFIDTADGVTLVHDWLDYAGMYLTGRYKTSNRERLEEIWRKHGRIYGRLPLGSSKEVVGKEQDRPPTNQPTNLTKPTILGRTIGGDEDKDRSCDNLSDYERVLTSCPAIVPAMVGPKQQRNLLEIIGLVGADASITEIGVAAGKSDPISYALTVVKNRIEAEAVKKQVRAEQSRKGDYND
jgi:hypothetical protein